MNGNKDYLVDLIEGRVTRFIIPVYQRNYDWKPEQCGRLFDDLVDVAKTGREEHFFGSIVSQTPRGKRIVIDGQQRITTLFLLLAAIRTQLYAGVIASQNAKLADYIKDNYLIDTRYGRYEQERKLRLKLIKNDSKALDAVLYEDRANYVQDSNVTQNFLYFLNRIETMEISADELLESIRSLCVIDIKLDPNDDAQLIFESLNSTGLGLSEADKIRNYVLMNLDQERQEEYYEKYWNKIELNTNYQVSEYIRYYMAARESCTPTIKKVYPSFCLYAKKNFSESSNPASKIKIKELLEELLRYSKYYHTCLYPDTKVGDIDLALRAIHLFNAGVTLPYLLNLLEYRAENKINDDEVAAILWTIDSFLFRRWVCEVPTNSLNGIFETLHSDALKGIKEAAQYQEVVKYLITHKSGNGRFPADQEFLEALSTRDFYRIQNRKFYLYDRLENGANKERVSVVDGLRDGIFSVEHIMPQTLSEEWKKNLGDDYEQIHEKWLHKMANLTLTAYNSDYSNRTFLQKRDIKDGFKESGFRMNRWIEQQDAWGEEQLETRERMLKDQFLSTWPYPKSSFTPKKVLPELATLDSNAEFKGRRITAFNFMGVRYIATQWNVMLVKVLQLVYELEPAKIYALADMTEYPGSSFCKKDTAGFEQVVDGVFVRKNSCTSAKIDLLISVFEFCNIEPDMLIFEMPLELESTQ